ncbi:alpha/beta fold hydrolase [Sphingomonas cavernae]|nr:alpha/beta hydrolase [Sphingomonas cavernae]
MISRRNMLIAGAAAAGAALLPRGVSAATGGFASSRLSVVVRGQGPDVILIPGLTASRDMWSGTVAALPGYRYHLIQLAGFAGDPARGNASGPVVTPVAQEIVRYIIANELKAPTVVGHSMGGLIALMIAARWPTRIGRTMVVDMLPAPAAGLGMSVAGLRPLVDGLRDSLTRTPEGRRTLDSLIGMFGPPDQGARKSDSGLVARAMHDIAVTDLTPELPRITTPLVVLYATVPGAQLDMAAVENAYRSGYAAAKRARLTRIAGSGHMIMLDQPQRFRTELKAFLPAAR